MPKVKALNMPLYLMLLDVFKDVRFRNPGEGMVLGDWLKRPDTGEYYKEILHPGEYYMVCCPFCNDTRHRLNINYRWGVLDKESTDPDGNQHSNLWLAICFNERCLDDHERRIELWEKVLDGDPANRLQKARLTSGKHVDPAKIQAEWPGEMIPVHELPANHDAYQYLLGRGFDPERIGRFWDVRYCAQSIHYLAKDRLVIPVKENGKLRGWQARYIGELKKGQKWPPKYWTMPGMSRSTLIYNFTNARQYKTGVVMEGTTDVWALGPMGMAVFGSTATLFQRRKLVNEFRDRNLLLCLDPEEFDKLSTQKLIKEFSHGLPGRFAAIKLPAGTDPGSLERGLLRQYLREKAAEQGLKVSWERYQPPSKVVLSP